MVTYTAKIKSYSVQLKSSIPSNLFCDANLLPPFPFLSLFSFFSLAYTRSCFVSDFASDCTSCLGPSFASVLDDGLASSSFFDLALKLPRSSPLRSASCFVYLPKLAESYCRLRPLPLSSSWVLARGQFLCRRSASFRFSYFSALTRQACPCEALCCLAAARSCAGRQ